MKYFLIDLEIRDGENEYDDNLLIKAINLKEANKKVKKAILSNWTDGSRKEAKRWDEEEQQLDLFDRIIEFQNLSEVPAKEAKVLMKWGHYLSEV